MNSPETSIRFMSGAEQNYTAEAAAIQAAALAGVSKVVQVGEITFFSTATGDAWMLDPADGFAVCLARDYETLPIPISESADKLLVEWNADYWILNDATFFVRERADRAYEIRGYPIQAIERMRETVRQVGNGRVTELLAVMDRLKTGRNETCPCGSGKKYKKCCLPNDEARGRVKTPGAARHDAFRGETSLPAAIGPTPWQTLTVEDDGDSPEMDREDEDATEEDTPEEIVRRDGLLDRSDAWDSPSLAEMEEVLTGLLALPPDVTDWAGVLRRFAETGHPDLPDVFRRIAAVAPHTVKDTAYFYWAATEKFDQFGQYEMLREVAAGFAKLDGNSYDSDALAHIEDYLLAGGFDEAALRLAEHFLPIQRADRELEGWSVTNTCEMIFHLRIGQALRAGFAALPSKEEWVARTRAGIEDKVDTELAATLAAVIKGEALQPEWTRGCFKFASDNFRREANRHPYLRFLSNLGFVAQEAWKVEQVSPGVVFHGLQVLADHALLNHVTTMPRNRRAPKGVEIELLEFLEPNELETRIADACGDDMGVNFPRARYLLLVCGCLTRFAERHALFSAADANRIQAELGRLARELERSE